jgi:HEAT repeat protein
MTSKSSQVRRVIERLAVRVITPEMEKQAAEALKQFPRNEVVPAFIEALRSGDCDLQLAAFILLPEFVDEDMVPTLMDLLHSEDRRLQTGAISTLSLIGPPATDALPLLRGLLDADDSFVELLAAQALLSIESSESERANEIIRKALRTPNAPECYFAVQFVKEHGDRQFVSELKALLNDEDGGLRSEASLAIWRLTGDLSDALAVGHDLRTDSDWLLRGIGEEHFQELGMTAGT